MIYVACFCLFLQGVIAAWHAQHARYGAVAFALFGAVVWTGYIVLRVQGRG